MRRVLLLAATLVLGAIGVVPAEAFIPRESLATANDRGAACSHLVENAWFSGATLRSSQSPQEPGIVARNLDLEWALGVGGRVGDRVGETRYTNQYAAFGADPTNSRDPMGTTNDSENRYDFQQRQRRYLDSLSPPPPPGPVGRSMDFFGAEMAGAGKAPFRAAYGVLLLLARPDAISEAIGYYRLSDVPELASGAVDAAINAHPDAAGEFVGEQLFSVVLLGAGWATSPLAAVGDIEASAAARGVALVKYDPEFAAWQAGARTLTLYRAVSEAEYQELTAIGEFRAGANSLGGKFFAESAGDAAKWGEVLEGPGKYRIIEVQVPMETAESFMRWERLDSIGPARYGELDQLKGVQPRDFKP